MIIDYLKSDVSILELASGEIGELYVLREVLTTVHGLRERDCRRYGIHTTLLIRERKRSLRQAPRQARFLSGTGCAS
ncbi:MAG: hypothetical protein ACE5JI_18155 [Acidobacteriota bacterium]